MVLRVLRDNNPQSIFDHHFTMKCPHCVAKSNISAVSIPRYEFLERFRPKKVGVVYRCDSCNEPIFLKFGFLRDDYGSSKVDLTEEYEEIERPSETFDYEYLPSEAEADFREALTCYSQKCFNAFAAMCRRTVQSIASNLGAKGKAKVLTQLKDLKSMADIDGETFDLLKQIVLDGHDGAHPHLPALNAHRADVLLELMKDVLYQLYVRKGRLQRAMALRAKAIANGKSIEETT